MKGSGNKAWNMEQAPITIVMGNILDNGEITWEMVKDHISVMKDLIKGLGNKIKNMEMEN